MILITESVVMLVLPFLLPTNPPRPVEAVVDAFLLSVVLAPIMWWRVVRPLKQAALQRDLFLTELFKTLEGERKRFAHELHDGVGQALTLLISGLKSMPLQTSEGDLLRRTQDLRQLAERALKDTKEISIGMRPTILDDFGLTMAIERIVTEIQQSHPTELQITFESDVDRRLDDAIESSLFRITQEALNNVLKHSSATQVNVDLRIDASKVVLTIDDNGCGFDVRSVIFPRQYNGHLGLIGMQERATLLHGEMQIESSPGIGTKLTVTIPMMVPTP